MRHILVLYTENTTERSAERSRSRVSVTAKEKLALRVLRALPFDKLRASRACRGMRLLLAPAEREQRDVVACAAVEREVGDDLTDNRTELEAVARTGRGDDHAAVGRQRIDHEMLVGCVGEETRLQPRRRPVRIREVALERDAEHGFVVGIAGRDGRVRVDQLAAMVVLANLETAAGVGWNSVEAALVGVEIEHGTRGRLEVLGHARLGPHDDLALDGQ